MVGLIGKYSVVLRRNIRDVAFSSPHPTFHRSPRQGIKMVRLSFPYYIPNL